MAKIEDILRHCCKWATDSNEILEICGAYIFGSFIHRSGEQFNPLKYSDFDIIVTIPSKINTASLRKDWLNKFRVFKQKLELSLIPLLHNPNSTKPIVSVVAITKDEILADIHKNGNRDFFQRNQFKSLLDYDSSNDHLLKKKPIEIEDRHREVIQFVQRIRNEYLAISASGLGGLSTWDDKDDALPKDIMRYAALATPMIKNITHENREFDVVEGLDSLSNYIYSHRSENQDLFKLNDIVAVRRGGRGECSLSPEDQLFLTEVIFDIAYKNFAIDKLNHKEATSKIDRLQSIQNTTNDKDVDKTVFIKAPGAEEINQHKGTELSKENYIFTSVIPGLESAMELFKDFVRQHNRIEALVICTDEIAEFLRKQKVNFFIDKKFTFLVLDDEGECITEREKEIELLGLRESSDYNIRRSIKHKINELCGMGNPERETITIKRYDLFPILEVWFFDEKIALFGLVQNYCSTRDQKFILCSSPSPLFSWLRRYYNYVEKISQLDKNFHNRNKT